MSDRGKGKPKRGASARANGLATVDDRQMRTQKAKWPPSLGEILTAFEMRADRPTEFKRSPRLKCVWDYGERYIRETLAGFQEKSIERLTPVVRAMFSSIPHKKREYIDLLGGLGEMLTSRSMADPVPNLSNLRRLVREGLPESQPAGRPAKTDEAIEARKLHDARMSWPQIARKLRPEQYAENPRAAAEAIRKAVERLTLSKIHS